MSRLQELLDELCPNGVEYKKVGQFARCIAGATPSKSNQEYWRDGTIPWMSSGEVNKGEIFETEQKITQKGYDSSSTKLVPPNTVVMALAGQGKTRGMVAITRIELCTNQSLCSFVVDETIIPEYLLYYFKSQYVNLRKVSNGDKEGARGGLNLKILNDYIVPVPPLEVQLEIVKILDMLDSHFEEIISKLSDEYTARKKQYEYYKDLLMSNNEHANKITLDEICKIKGRIGFRGYTQKDIVEKGMGAISLSPGNIVNNHLVLDECKYISWDKYYESPEIMIEKSDVLLCKTGSTVGKVTIVDDDKEKMTLNPQLVVLKEIKCNHRYLFYQLSRSDIQQQIKASAGIGSVPNISQASLGKLLIDIPSENEQEQIVSLLDRFDSICNEVLMAITSEIESRKKQYEHYRDKLLSFKDLADV